MDDDGVDREDDEEQHDVDNYDGECDEGGK